ncbi:DUF6191 domain-containing protein [Streptomyces sp. BV286]|uniref:DUF6191 domain-containing protein n=1 Tax=Streptomyces sp. BV286 TaxID=2849672 RepID=UPI0020C627CB|nr:DUF6191 domain-containing protein [Streptomyces sp. BV286]
MINELFAPGRKHTDEERKRLELTRVDLNDGDPGRGPIDLTSGKVVVRLPGQPASGAPDGHDRQGDPDGQGDHDGQGGHDSHDDQDDQGDHRR